MADKAYECAAQGIQIAGDPSSLYDIDLATGELTLRGQITPSSIYNAIGYNVLDGNIYAMAGGSVVILDASQTVQLLPAVPNLPVQAYVAGDISLQGRYYLYSLAQPEVIYVIDADPTSPTYMKLIDPATGLEQTAAPFGVPTAPAFYADWAFSPADGMLYAAMSSAGTVARIDPLTGAQTVLATTGLPPAGEPLPVYGAAFADAAGALYAIENNTGRVYRIVISGDTAAATLFSQAQPSVSTDGARCPLAPIDALSIEKTVDKAEAFAGETLRYTITVKNVSLAVLTGVTVTDVPAGGLAFVPGSLTLNGAPVSGSPADGVAVGTLAPGASAVLAFSVSSGPALPSPNPVGNVASVTFDTGAPRQSEPAVTR